MNKLFIIGNGFDLAHGMKTSYSDFILWYLKKALKEALHNRSYSDGFITVHGNNYSERHLNFNSITDYKSRQFNVVNKSSLYPRLIEHLQDLNWVDVESEYYELLIQLYKKYDKSAISKKTLVTSLIELNISFEVLKNELWNYLTEITKNFTYLNKDLYNNFSHELSQERKTNISNANPQICILNFNYTNTIQMYVDRMVGHKVEHISIHGNIGESNKNQIFGYGDELDEYYYQFERLNIKEYLNYFKSFGYFMNGRYKQLQSFIKSGEFRVFIMGHSCGLSDRLLFNSIFEHENCQSIKLYYYQKSKESNDYFEKTQEISRHFTRNRKRDMRDKIVPFTECKPLIPFADNENAN